MRSLQELQGLIKHGVESKRRRDERKLWEVGQHEVSEEKVHGFSWQVLIHVIISHASLQRAELEAAYSSIRPRVRPLPRASSKPMLSHHMVLSGFSQNHLCILLHLAMVAFKAWLAPAPCKAKSCDTIPDMALVAALPLTHCSHNFEVF